MLLNVKTLADMFTTRFTKDTVFVTLNHSKVYPITTNEFVATTETSVWSVSHTFSRIGEKVIFHKPQHVYNLVLVRDLLFYNVSHI